MGHDNPRSLERIATALSHEAGTAWLDGSMLYDAKGRFSFVGCTPAEVVASSKDSADVLSLFGRLQGSGVRLRAFDPELLTPVDVAAATPQPEWVGYVAYEASASSSDRLDYPKLYFARYDAFWVFDAQEKQLCLLAESLEAARALKERTHEHAARETDVATLHEVVASSEHEHRSAIEKAKDAIYEGEVYEINLARRWSGRLRGTPMSFYRAMRKRSPVPYGFYLDAGAAHVLGSTMETFLRWDNATRTLLTEPIKGTMRLDSDVELNPDILRGDPKEHAEHAMVVDLMRNDLGRVAEPGTVHVDSLMEVRRFSGLAHMVSRVLCQVADGHDLESLMRATFPPGSITGTPKRRAMELIRELEGRPRGVYTGCVGYIDRGGSATFAVAIRTAVCTPSGGAPEAFEIVYHAGGGIVAASDPEREVAETNLKAQVFTGGEDKDARESSLLKIANSLLEDGRGRHSDT